VDPQEHLLGELFGFGPVAEHAERHAEDAVLVSDHQVLEGSRVAAPEPVHQGGIITGPPFHPVRPYRPPRVSLTSKFDEQRRRAVARAHQRLILPTIASSRGLPERIRMLREDQARELADHWVKAWNSHDLDRIMAH